MLRNNTTQILLLLIALLLALLIGITLGRQSNEGVGSDARVSANDSAQSIATNSSSENASLAALKQATQTESTAQTEQATQTQQNDNDAPKSDPLAAAETAYQNGDHALVVELLQPLAEKGNAVAQQRLGYMYSAGLGVETDTDKAIFWLEKAVSNNIGAAKPLLIEQLQARLAQSSDPETQLPTLTKLESLGDVDAKAVLGSYLLTGTGTEAQPVKAVELLREAAENGDRRAMSNLGYAYSLGVGVVANDQKAFNWYKQAAELGLVRAQVAMAAFLEQGKGTEPDLPEAARWYLNAASAGNALATKRVGEFILDDKIIAPPGEDAANIILGLAMDGNDDAVTWLVRQTDENNLAAQAAYAQLLLSADHALFNAADGISLLEDSAKNGVPGAQVQLAKQYASGEHLDLSPVKAYAWANLAAAEGSAEGKTVRDAMGVLLTPAQVVEGQALSTSLFESNK